jgi:hypothetical protein
MPESERLLLPIVSAGAEFLVMGHLMRRNVLAYKAPPNNEGYDLICIHPNPRHRPSGIELPQVRVQVKSRYASDCDRSVPIKPKTMDAFDFVVVVFMNIGNFFSKKDCGADRYQPEFYTLPQAFAAKHQDPRSKWGKVKLKKVQDELEPFKGDAGFEQIAVALGVPKPARVRT